MATTIGNQITLDGTFSDWPANGMIMTANNAVAGYQVYGALLNDATLGNTYVIGIDATESADSAIGAGTTIYLNTDQNDATGYSPSWAAGAVGAEYEIQFEPDSNNVLQAYLYSLTAAGAPTLIGELNSGFSTTGQSVEVAIPQTLLTPTGASAPTAINFEVLFDTGSALPTAFSAGTPNMSSPILRSRRQQSPTRSRSTEPLPTGRRPTWS